MAPVRRRPAAEEDDGSAAQAAADNQATFKRFHDVMSTGDAELVSKTIDEVVEPDVLIRTPLPVEATGAQALKQVAAMLLQAFPDLHLTVEIVIFRFVDGRIAETWGVVDVFAQMRRLGVIPSSRRGRGSSLGRSTVPSTQLPRTTRTG